MNSCYDRVIIGAGIYGLYGAIKSLEKGHKVLVLERDNEACARGTLINQARLHNGYHYPRSYSTASKSAKYFNRFLNDYRECINTEFIKVYGIASNYSWANASQFKKFSDNLGVLCEEIETKKYFNDVEVEKSFLTNEYTFDAKLIKEKLLMEFSKNNGDIIYNAKIRNVENIEKAFNIILESGEKFQTKFILNATYASTNQIHELLGYEKLGIKYELCEVILCNVTDNIKNVGLTLMDGPFFSIMPFGKTGYHSLTTVSRTPHVTSYDKLPTFNCQSSNKNCTIYNLDNCNRCESRPSSAFYEMYQTARKYLNRDIDIEYEKSLFTIKPILKNSEIDDSRPTIIRQYSSDPDFYTVFSGKINTMYDLDSIL